MMKFRNQNSNKIKFQMPQDNSDNDSVHSYEHKRIHSDYGTTLDSDLMRLRMELNQQSKNLNEQVNLLKFKAKQAAQQRELERNDLERVIQSVKNKTNRFMNHEKPLKDLQNVGNKYRLRSERTYGDASSSHSRRNLDTYQKLYFNDFKTPSHQYAHNDNDPFNINVSVPAQPQMHYNPKPSYSNSYGGGLQTNSQTIGLEMPIRHPEEYPRSRPDPLSYGMKEFTNESAEAMHQIGKFVKMIVT